MVLRVLLFFALITVIFTHFYFGFRNVIPQSSIRTYNIAWIAVVLIFLTGTIGMSYFFAKGIGEQNIAINVLMTVNFLIVIPTIVMSILLLTLDFGRLLSSFTLLIAEKRSLFPMVSVHELFYKIIAGVGLTLAVLVLYGSTIGKYWYKVHEVAIYSNDLPAEFDGFKIAQISDIHTGSYDYKKGVIKGVDLVNKQNPDLIIFSGDLVNVRASEAFPYIPIFRELHATYGKYSVMGNHDYAAYGNLSPAFKRENFKQLLEVHKKMGFHIMNNKAVKIEKDSSYIVIAGVENWGLPPFPAHGDLAKALEETNANDFKILISHDPSHWDAEVKQSDKNVQLTVSGHTHGMQFGIDLPWFKWSPVSLKYRKWAGLYTENNKQLYVNRGFGFIGYPGRIGIRPEITVFTLRKIAK